MVHLPRFAVMLGFLALVFCNSSLVPAQDAKTDSPEFTVGQLEFFETKVRPLLAERCYSCHSGKAKALKAGLRLDAREHVLKGGDSGTSIIVGKPDESLLIQSIRYESYEMPPDGKLKDAQIATLVKWVEMGAPWPKGTATAEPAARLANVDWAEVRNGHWAWQPVAKHEPPSVPASHPVRNAIDQFVGAKLHEAGLEASLRAEPRVLCRRIWIDLVGYPPTPEKVDEFVAAAKADYSKATSELIDELLASPHYGERWGRHWLDVARYSDGFGGFLDNAGLPYAWRYRDWVVGALNRDVPYDDFLRLQIAGDLLAPNEQAGVATGFFALGPTYISDGGDPDSVAQAKGETLDDRVDTLTRGLLGLTVACARCHDHKFDPIPTQDYYSLAGVFNNTRFVEYPLAAPEIVRIYNERQNEIRQVDRLQKDLANQLKKEKRGPNDDEKKRQVEWQTQLDALKKTAPPKYEVAHALADSGSSDMQVALRGNLRKPGEAAPRRFLRLIEGAEPAPFTTGSGRLELAESIASKDNPLTARVFVNRVWLHHFGKALVRSPSNFGTLGEKPTHPELLDWLAATFMENGWSIKDLHRLIMDSATYQMSSRINDRGFGRDGDNRLIWRMNPRRFDVEAWRDSLLTVTGEIDLNMGGGPVGDIERSRRRTIYAQASRNGDRFASDRFLQLFDFPLMRATIAKRPISIVPQQFLFMLNSSFMTSRANALVTRLEENSKSDTERIQLAYQLLFGRDATPREMQIGLAFITNEEPQEPEPARERPMPETPNADILIADFEGDSYGDWKVDGEAFGPHPARGTLPGQMVVSGFAGQGLVNSFFKGDGTVGRLTSPAIKIERPFIRFLVGGGGYRNETYMALKVDGKEVRTALGPNIAGGGSEKLAWAVWDVRDFVGKSCVFEIVDNRRGGWGHINVDHIFQSARDDGPVPVGEAPAAGTPSKLDRWVQYAQVLLSSNEFMYVR
ncbi:MAG: PSD1 and planctomycete cytochrome C domain-containing protein [Planctomycetota bacterium]|nr:PSD1 and planctomycete cytochrome C domain-containing protein [Planctomycetota bacterium]MDA1248366.1 PSD1 and planctomycete cytochrome C domain-containing protein [Planctomycetota bacterium]